MRKVPLRRMEYPSLSGLKLAEEAQALASAFRKVVLTDRDLSERVRSVLTAHGSASD